jgi:opacity protein-like surface antigen
MKTKFCAAVLIGILAPAAARADDAPQSGTASIQLMGKVPAVCTLINPTLSGDAMEQGASGNFASRALITGFAGSEGLHSGSEFRITFEKGTCNFMAYLSLSSSNVGMRPGSTTPVPGFAAQVHYTATAVWGSGGPTVTLNTASQAKANNGVRVSPRSEPVTIDVRTAPSTLPLLNTTSPYQDTLTVQVGEAL